MKIHFAIIAITSFFFSSCLLPYIPPGQQNENLQGNWVMMIDTTRTITIQGNQMNFYVDSILIHTEMSTQFTADYFNIPCIAFTPDTYEPCTTDGGYYSGQFSHNREGTIDYHTITSTGNQYLPTRPLDFVFIKR